MKKIYIVLVISILCGKIAAQSSQVLRYNRPADFFEESLVLGNGKMGATVFGGVESDKIYLNDITLWSGEPVNANMNPQAYKNLPAIREVLKNENYKLAEELNKKLQGKNSESYAPLGTMNIESHHSGKASNYHRELNISNAVSKVSYEMDGVKFTREYFVSAPDQIMVIKLTSSKKGALNFDINSNSLLQFKTEVKNNVLSMNGVAPIHENPGYTVVPEFLLEKERGTRFTTLMKIKNLDGTITNSNSSLGLKNATEALIYVSIATSFNGFDKNPATQERQSHCIRKFKQSICQIIRKIETNTYCRLSKVLQSCFLGFRKNNRLEFAHRRAFVALCRWQRRQESGGFIFSIRTLFAH